MREIKFRAWDSRSRTMFNVDVLAISPCGWSCPDYDTRGVSLAYQPQIEVMQFTGLRDRNDKDIYEGDIIKAVLPNHGVGSDITLAQNPVYYDESSFRVRQNDHPGSGIRLDDLAPNVEIKVIGNIYESPHLLEVAAK